MCRAHTTWNLYISFEKCGEQDGHLCYRISSAQGTWSVANAGNPCDIDGTVHLDLRPAERANSVTR